MSRQIISLRLKAFLIDYAVIIVYALALFGIAYAIRFVLMM